MASDEINQYYESTANRPTRDVLVQAADTVLQTFEQGIAIDCGCGAGADLSYLQARGFEVFGFDVEAEAIELCRAKAGKDPRVHLQQATFTSYEYPRANLIVADASLFFCPPAEFPAVWQKITDALEPGGLFVGGFLGARDTMASGDYDTEAFWPDVMTVSEVSLKAKLSAFEILAWQEHELDGKTAQGVDHHWHVFAITVRKL